MPTLRQKQYSVLAMNALAFACKFEVCMTLMPFAIQRLPRQAGMEMDQRVA